MPMTPFGGRYGVTTTTGPAPQPLLDPNVALGAQGVRVAGTLSRAVNSAPKGGALSPGAAPAATAPDAVAPAVAAAGPGAATAPGAAGVGDAAALSSGAGTGAEIGAGETASAAASTLPEDATNIAGGAATTGIGAGLGPGMLAGSVTGYLSGNGGTTASTAGSAVGTVAGSIIGSEFPVIGTVLGGMAGGAIGGLFANGGRAAQRGALAGPGMIGQRPAIAGALSGVHGHVAGPGDGRSDSIHAMLSSGEYVVPADVVSALGNGSNDAGANALDQHVMHVRSRQVQKLQNLPPPRGAQNLATGGAVSGDPSFASPQAFGASLMTSPYR